MHWGCCCPPGATTNYKAATFRAGQKVCAAVNRSRIRFSAFWDKLRVKTWFEYVRLSGVFITSSCSWAICASLRGCGFCLPWRRFSVQFLPHIGFSHLGHSAEKPFNSEPSIVWVLLNLNSIPCLLYNELMPLCLHRTNTLPAPRRTWVETEHFNKIIFY